MKVTTRVRMKIEYYSFIKTNKKMNIIELRQNILRYDVLHLRYYLLNIIDIISTENDRFKLRIIITNNNEDDIIYLPHRETAVKQCPYEIRYKEIHLSIPKTLDMTNLYMELNNKNYLYFRAGVIFNNCIIDKINIDYFHVAFINCFINELFVKRIGSVDYIIENSYINMFNMSSFDRNIYTKNSYIVNYNSENTFTQVLDHISVIEQGKVYPILYNALTMTDHILEFTLLHKHLCIFEPKSEYDELYRNTIHSYWYKRLLVG